MLTGDPVGERRRYASSDGYEVMTITGMLRSTTRSSDRSRPQIFGIITVEHDEMETLVADPLDGDGRVCQRRDLEALHVKEVREELANVASSSITSTDGLTAVRSERTPATMSQPYAEPPSQGSKARSLPRGDIVMNRGENVLKAPRPA